MTKVVFIKMYKIVLLENCTLLRESGQVYSCEIRATLKGHVEENGPY